MISIANEAAHNGRNNAPPLVYVSMCARTNILIHVEGLDVLERELFVLMKLH